MLSQFSFSVAGINTMTKCDLGRKGFVWLTTDHSWPLKEVGAGTQSKNLEAGTGAESRRGIAYWLVLHTLSGLCYIGQDYSLGSGIAYSGLNTPTSIIKQENAV